MTTQPLEQHTEILLPQMKPDVVSREIEDFIIGQVLSNNATGAVVGLSGGVDSTTVGALAQRAFARYNNEHDKPLNLVAYLLPSKTNDVADTKDGATVAKRLGIRYETHNIEPLIESYRHTNPEAFETKYDRGNLTSRIRATVLNTKAATEAKVLLGTGNKDEDFGIGYYTLFGDGAVHCSPIGELSKRLVKQMASYVGFSDLAQREPTAGLEPQQTDFHDLGYRYDVVELVSEGREQGLSKEQLATHPQVASLIMKQQQDYAAHFGAAKFDGPAAAIEDILRRHDIALRKAALIHPATPKITLEYCSASHKDHSNERNYPTGAA